MSSAFDLLKTIGKPSKPYKGFSKLPHGNYEILGFRLVRNKMYNKNSEKSLKRVLLVELKDQVLFLPEYFAYNLNDDDKKVEELNSDGVKKYLYFGGSRSNKSWIIQIKTEEDLRQEETEIVFDTLDDE